MRPCLLSFEEQDLLLEQYGDNPVLQLLQCSFRPLEREMDALQFSCVEIFLNFFVQLDTLLLHPEKAEAICRSMGDDVYCDLRKSTSPLGRTWTDSELKTATDLVLYAVVLCFESLNSTRFGMHLSELLMFQISDVSKLIACSFPNLNKQEHENLVSFLTVYFEQPERISAQFEKRRKSINKPETVRGGGSNRIPLPPELDTENAQKYFQKAIARGYMEIVGPEKFRWVGTVEKGRLSQLAYFCGCVYGYKHGKYGNEGENIPHKELEKLFNVKRLYDSLVHAHDRAAQAWRIPIDNLFKEDT